MVNCVNSLDDWKVIVRVLFEDGKNEIERAQVLHVFHRDTKRTLILKGKTKEALEIHLHYLTWKLRRPYLQGYLRAVDCELRDIELTL